MADEFDTIKLQEWVKQYQAGDMVARDRLIQATLGRLESMACRMLKQFPRVQRWEETADILQNSILRLMQALRAAQFDSTKAYFSMAAALMRRELIDMVRHYTGPLGLDRNMTSVAGKNGDSSGDDDLDKPASEINLHQLESWANFHEAVETLPVEEREVFCLKFYHNWSNPQIAELFVVDERTIRRRWNAGCVRLRQVVGGDMPI